MISGGGTSATVTNSFCYLTKDQLGVAGLFVQEKSSTITMSEKRDDDGTAYTKYTMNYTNTGTGYKIKFLIRGDNPQACLWGKSCTNVIKFL